MVWKPNVTVAAIIERDGRFLLVEEETSKGLRFNQPAGHLEENESLIDAVKREVLEETAWVFEPQHVISTQIWRRSPNHTTFLRFCFTGTCNSHNPNQLLDEGIVATHWLTYDEIKLQSGRMRSPLVLSSITDYLNGQRYPLTLLQAYFDHG